MCEDTRLNQAVETFARTSEDEFWKDMVHLHDLRAAVLMATYAQLQSMVSTLRDEELQR